QAVTEFFELTVGEFQVPARFDGSPALLKLDSVGFGQMGCGVTLHVNDTKLDVGMGEQTFGNRQQSAEVVMNHDHDATKSTFNQSPLDQLPILEIFTAWSCHAGEDLFFAAAPQADDGENTSG